MVLTSSRYLNRFRSYYFLNIDVSMFFTNINHDDVRRHDSTVHYILYDDVRRHDSSKVVNGMAVMCSCQYVCVVIGITKK